jgi:predicted RNase H-related nuclease YkuK (DUF458 family)
MQFRRFSNRQDVDLVQYIKDYMKTEPNIELLVGCDSQNQSTKTIYAIVVALYRPGKGAHLLYRRWSTPKEYTRSVRLLNEVWYSVETAEEMRNNGLDVKFVDIDLNPDPKYKSNEVFRQAVGLVEGMGFSVRYKTLGPIMTYAADHLVKSA